MTRIGARNARRWTAVAALALGLTTRPVAAQPPPPTESPKDIPLPGVTVEGLLDQPYNPTSAPTATKIDVPLRDLPQSIQVVPRQVIDDQRALGMSDVLRNVSGFSPSVNSQSQRFGERNAIFRGFTTNNYYTNGFKDTLNGSSFTFGLANIERVEVLKGPSSVLYGLGEPGATINVVTKQPLPDWYAAAALTAGSFGFVSPSIDVSGPLTPGKELRFRLNGAYQQADSFVDNIESERYLVAPVLALALGRDTLITLEGELQELQEINYSGLPAEGTIRRNPNGRLPISRDLGDAGVEGDHFPERTLGKIGYRLEHRFNEHVALRHGFRATFFKRNERDVLPFGFQADLRTFDRDLFIGKGHTDDYYVLTDGTFDFRTGPLQHKLVVGADQRVFSSRTLSGSGLLPPIDAFNPTYGVEVIGAETLDRASIQSGTFFGFYLQDLVTIIEPVKLLVGGRYDLASLDTESRNLATGAQTFSDFDEGVFTPRVGLVVQPIRPVSLYASYTTSFNPLTGTTFDGAAFEPERGVQYEAGVKLQFLGGKLSSTLAVYELTRENVLTPDPANPGFSIQEGEQRSRGVEVDVAGEVLPGLRLIATYAYTDAEITQSTAGTEGNRPANVPPHTGSIWGVYEFRQGILEGLGLGAGVIAVGRRPADNDNTATLPDYVRTDAAIYYKLTRHLDLAVNVRNLFDVRYYETSTFGDPFGGISPGAPLSVFGSITARY
jgi:iron complex outermembrane recepter protein